MKRDNQATKQRGIPTRRVIDIELLALDLDSCTRCVGTLDNIEKAIDIVRPILGVMELQANVRKIVVESEEQARKHEFATSPTVRINGKDITFETIESACDSCTDLCGCDEGTSCRVWSYEGKEYTEAPVGLVVESILRTILDNNPAPKGERPEFGGIPDNLKRFFKSKLHRRTAANPCCSPSEQDTCCEPSQKASCCETSETETCGCH